LNQKLYALTPKFEELFDSAVDKAMLLLGESGRQATYYHLEKTFGIKRDMWHKNPEAFAEAVEQIFGSGGQLLVKAIIKELYTDLGLEFKESKEFSFTYLIREAKRYVHVGENLIKKVGERNHEKTKPKNTRR
jgi:hypothetical protein